MSVNWKVRLKNPYFWIGLAGVIFAAMGISTDTLTSWQALGDAFMDLIKNPYMLVSVIMAVMGTITDPTTAGLGDSKKALTYTSPKKDVTIEEEI